LKEAMSKIPGIMLTTFMLAAGVSTLPADNCNSCHASKGVRESIPTVDPIKIRTDGKIRTISLPEAFHFHGHSCPGLTVTFRALQYGLLLLFDKEVPAPQDLAIVARTPLSGGLDLLDLVMTGEKRERKTYPPDGMKSDRNKIIFTLYRKSTSTAVDIQLKPEHYPKDFFEYKKKQAAKKLTPEEWQVLHGYMKGMILKFPTLSFEDLFDKPQPYKTIMWGSLAPAHNKPPTLEGDD